MELYFVYLAITGLAAAVTMIILALRNSDNRMRFFKYAGISVGVGLVGIILSVANPLAFQPGKAVATIDELPKTRDIDPVSVSGEVEQIPKTKDSLKESSTTPEKQIRQYLSARCGDVISNVVLNDGILSIFIDLSKGNLNIPVQTSKIGATFQDVIITDEFLESADFDNYWDTIVMDFGEIGKVNHDKGEISDLGNERHFIDVDYSGIADLDTNSDDKELDAAIQEVVDIIQENSRNDSKSDANASLGEKNALGAAISYLNYSAFSYEGLKGQLEYEGYSESEQQYAVDNCGADWSEQALRAAKSYLDYSAFSYKGLIEQLEYEKYTHEQAVYGADNCGADWGEQAARSAKSYLGYSSFSRSGLIEQLEYDGYTHDQAEYGVFSVGY